MTPRHVMEDNIKMDLKETEYEIVDIIFLVQGICQCRAVLKTAMELLSDCKLV